MRAYGRRRPARLSATLTPVGPLARQAVQDGEAPGGRGGDVHRLELLHAAAGAAPRRSGSVGPSCRARRRLQRPLLQQSTGVRGPACGRARACALAIGRQSHSVTSCTVLRRRGVRKPCRCTCSASQALRAGDTASCRPTCRMQPCTAPAPACALYQAVSAVCFLCKVLILRPMICHVQMRNHSAFDAFQFCTVFLSQRFMRREG